MNTITYNLANTFTENSSFYNSLEKFTDSFLFDANKKLGHLAQDYLQFLKTNNNPDAGVHDDYILEILIIGVLWNNYASKAFNTKESSTQLLKKLYVYRKEHPSLKPQVDWLRGKLSTFLLDNPDKAKTEYTLSNFESLLHWLSATGEFNEEVIRMSGWFKYWETKSSLQFQKDLSSIAAFGETFTLAAKNALGHYTMQLTNFQKYTLKSYKYREDYFFVGRKENEYHMNMVGAEIMNRNLREKFENTKYKAALLPACMRTVPEGGCKAVNDGKELVCTMCNSQCNIGQVAKNMKEKNVKTYIIPHSSQFSKFLVKWANNSETGLIGVACVLNLLGGGYEMKRLNIPSQCVFLDYCGCKKHWHQKGIPTNLSITKLEKIVA